MYGLQDNGSKVCTNVEPGTYNHECGKPAKWVGQKESGFMACFCDDCKAHGYEAKQMKKWFKLD